jgi:hypothetical protein
MRPVTDRTTAPVRSTICNSGLARRSPYDQVLVVVPVEDDLAAAELPHAVPSARPTIRTGPVREWVHSAARTLPPTRETGPHPGMVPHWSNRLLHRVAGRDLTTRLSQIWA